MEVAGLGQGVEACHIQFVIAEGIEAQGETVTDQVWLCIRIIYPQRFLKMCPSDAEIVLGSRGG